MEIKLYLRMLQRSWWIIALTGLVALCAALVASYLATPIYRSSARYIVSPNPSYLKNETDYNLIYSLDTLDKRTIITTYAGVLNSPRIYAETVQSLNLAPSDVAGYSYSAVVLPETNIIQFSMDGPDPARVAALTNGMGQHAVQYVEGLYQVYNMSLLDPASVAVQPISPNPLRDGGVALVVGLALGAALALLNELLRTPFRNFRQRRTLDEGSLALNRATFESNLKDVALLSNKEFCLCLVQIEGLRDYIDVLPETTLENVLRHVTQVLREQLRGNDLVGRWDDLDFAVLLSGTAGPAALNTMNRVRTALSVPIKLDVSEEDLHLNPRIGIAEYQAGDSDLALINNTNRALELARKNGDVQLLTAARSG
jgi:diguanylate cyclase (GGDEF)-like protein